MKWNEMKWNEMKWKEINKFVFIFELGLYKFSIKKIYDMTVENS